ncbi:MAG: hypothetical protein AB7F53_01395 [Nitrososphaeraceae archaeon]
MTFFVIFILRPVNKTGVYSPILPRIHKFVIPLSTLSIISGSILTMINIDFEIDRLFESIWGYLLVIGGSFSIPVYLIVIFRSKKPDRKLQLRKKKSFQYNNYIPYVAFLLLSITISLMIFVTHWIYPI